MKPQEAELVTEISKLQCMVSELKTGFSSAMLELGKIQHGDSFVREELEENRRSCRKKALRLEVLVEALREELGVMQGQILQLYSSSSSSQRAQQEEGGSKPKQMESDSGECVGGRTGCQCCPPAPASTPRGRALLHCFLQGLRAGLCEQTDARQQVLMQLLHSEWEYVSALNHIHDTCGTAPAQQPHQTYLRFVEQMLQRHLLFRNTLQERLSAQHWKSLIGDILVQLIGHNDASFSDMYVGYTSSLMAFLSLELNRVSPPENTHRKQDGQVEKAEVKVLSLLLAPVSRVHSYLSHIQSLLQWTGKEHPDCSLLLGSERALRATLSRCHALLEEDARWEDEEAAVHSCSGSHAACVSCCCGRRHRESQSGDAGHGDGQQGGGLANGCPSLNLECWSCSPVRRDRLPQNKSALDCGHDSYHHGGLCSLQPSDAHGCGENSDSGQGTFSQPTGKGTNEPESGRSHDDCETDPDDTSAFDYSSVTSCSPDGTLRMGMAPSNSGEEEEEEEEEDSQVPVLLKPSYKLQQLKEAPRERTVCLRWQIPRLTPQPPPRSPAGPCTEGATPCLVSSYGKRLVSIRKGSPPLHPKSAFRPIWDDPSKQADTAPERDHRQGFVPVQAQGQTFSNFNHKTDTLRVGTSRQRGGHAGRTASGRGLWDESEDSEGPCSTV